MRSIGYITAAVEKVDRTSGGTVTKMDCRAGGEAVRAGAEAVIAIFGFAHVTKRTNVSRLRVLCVRCSPPDARGEQEPCN